MVVSSIKMYHESILMLKWIWSKLVQNSTLSNVIGLINMKNGTTVGNAYHYTMLTFDQLLGGNILSLLFNAIWYAFAMLLFQYLRNENNIFLIANGTNVIYPKVVCMHQAS